jgi:hypothetical protein
MRETNHQGYRQCWWDYAGFRKPLSSSAMAVETIAATVPDGALLHHNVARSPLCLYSLILYTRYLPHLITISGI